MLKQFEVANQHSVEFAAKRAPMPKLTKLARPLMFDLESLVSYKHTNGFRSSSVRWCRYPDRLSRLWPSIPVPIHEAK